MAFLDYNLQCFAATTSEPVYFPAQLSAFSSSVRGTYLAGVYISIARTPTFSGRVVDIVNHERIRC